jgi:hypothetical protein
LTAAAIEAKKSRFSSLPLHAAALPGLGDPPFSGSVVGAGGSVAAGSSVGEAGTAVGSLEGVSTDSDGFVASVASDWSGVLGSFVDVA